MRWDKAPEKALHSKWTILLNYFKEVVKCTLYFLWL